MTAHICLREVKMLLSAGKVVEANSIVENLVYSLLNERHPRQAARVNLVFLGRLAARARNIELSD
jgi:hypothetical protein